jgi:hypothetical protein
LANSNLSWVAGIDQSVAWLFTQFSNSMLKRLLFFWRRNRRTTWTNEFFFGSYRALVGVAFNEAGGVHYVIRLQERNDNGVYKDVKDFRSYKWPQVTQLMGHVEGYTRSLPQAG